MHTTCTKCYKSFDAVSEEDAYDPDRLCPACYQAQDWVQARQNEARRLLVEYLLSQPAAQPGATAGDSNEVQP